MSDQTDNIFNLVKAYGLSHEESKIYLLLLQYGASTALTISKQLVMGRTKVYRLLDKLHAKQLVEFLIGKHGMKFSASHPVRFEQLVHQQKSQLQTLQDNLPALMSQLQSLIASSQNKSKVVVYEGLDGLKQVSWNATKAKDELRIYEIDHISDFLPLQFAEEFRRELVTNKILNKDLTNRRSFGDYTQVKELVKNYSQVRHISPKLLQIQFEVLLYNDVYATYTYKAKEIFCVEIHNQQLASMQKQLFDFVWQKAQPMTYVSEGGACKLVRQKA